MVRAFAYPKPGARGALHAALAPEVAQGGATQTIPRSASDPGSALHSCCQPVFDLPRHCESRDRTCDVHVNSVARYHFAISHRSQRRDSNAHSPLYKGGARPLGDVGRPRDPSTRHRAPPKEKANRRSSPPSPLVSRRSVSQAWKLIPGSKIETGQARSAARCDILAPMKHVKDVAITPLRGAGLGCGGSCGCGCGSKALGGIYDAAGKAQRGAVMAGAVFAGALAVALLLRFAK